MRPDPRQEPIDSRFGTMERVDSDMPCARCGYNLRTLSIDACCPECATAVRSSVADVWAGTAQLQRRICVRIVILNGLPAAYALLVTAVGRWRPWGAMPTASCLDVLLIPALLVLGCWHSIEFYDLVWRDRSPQLSRRWLMATVGVLAATWLSVFALIGWN